MYHNSYIFGIKKFGETIIVSENVDNSDLNAFEYLCQVSLKSSGNDNYTYDVSIVNKNMVLGMPIGKWIIKKGEIHIYLVNSFYTLTMSDDQGKDSSIIVGRTEKVGSRTTEKASIVFLTRAIFTKAQEIVRDYPDAMVCNAIMELEKSKQNFNLSYHINRYNEVINKGDNVSYIDFMEFAANDILKYIKKFKEAADLLKKYDDQRSMRLLKDITSECRRLLDCFKVENKD